MPSIKFLEVALTFFFTSGLLVSFGTALQCWECNSKYDPNCGEPFKNHTIALTDCSQRFLRQEPEVHSTICRKITQKVQGETRIIRSCGYLNPEDAGTCVARAGTHLVFMHYCQCAEERCNQASGLMPGFSLLASLLATAILMHLARSS